MSPRVTGILASESMATSALVPPQDVFESSGSWEDAVKQEERWDDLTPYDRLFNLCMLEPWRS